MPPARTLSSPRMYWRMKLVAGGAVVLAHATAIALLVGSTFARPSSWKGDAKPATVIEILDQPRRLDTAPLPDITLAVPALKVDALEVVNFEDSDSEEGVVVGSASAPRLSRLQTVSSAVFARNAGVMPGHPATVVLAILISEEGRVNDARVARSCGNAAVDAAAVDYALTLRWIPGTQNHQPQAMRITFPVILSAGA
jgi:TonB family protein